MTFVPPDDALKGSPANLRYPDPPFKKKSAPAAATSSPPVRSSASVAEPPSAKRKRVKSPAPAAKSASFSAAGTPSKSTRASTAAAAANEATPKVTVDVLVDGVSALDEPVAVPSNVDELVEESKASALELVETLKAEGKLDGPSSGLKRTHEESNAMVALIEPARIEPRTRRYISLAGALALGAATCVHASRCWADPCSFAAPYFFS